MPNQEKLEALIQKGIDCGWAPHYEPRHWDVREILHWYRLGEWADKQWHDDNWKKFIFSHDFAKALFGGEPEPVRLTWGDTTRYEEPELLAWQYHLQQAVISADPIDYAYKAVFGETE